MVGLWDIAKGLESIILEPERWEKKRLEKGAAGVLFNDFL